MSYTGGCKLLKLHSRKIAMRGTPKSRDGSNLKDDHMELHEATALQWFATPCTNSLASPPCWRIIRTPSLVIHVLSQEPAAKEEQLTDPKPLLTGAICSPDSV